jgi:ATP phosphoribosyltransferase
LADYIVDVVDTGNTLKANGLAPLEHIADISSRLDRQQGGDEDEACPNQGDHGADGRSNRYPMICF